MAPAQPLADINRQAFPGKQIEDGQGAHTPAVGELIGHEVHAPDLITRRRRSSLLTMHGGRVSPRALPPQRQPLLGVEAIASLFADLPAFPLEEDRSRRYPKRTRVCASSRIRWRSAVNGSRQLS